MGLKEANKETWEKCEKHLKTSFKNKICIKGNIIIEGAHRTKSSPEVRKSKPRNIFLKKKTKKRPISLIIKIFVRKP